MKKLSKILVGAAIAVLPLLAGPPVSAQSFTCQIGYTGPDSNNKCVSTTKYECTVNNTNNVTIKNTNTQEATTGDVTVNSNTTGGSGTSGTVSNTNGSTFNVVINNGGGEEGPGVCEATEVIPATPVTPPPAGGGGQAAGGEGGDVLPAVLPATSSDPTVPLAIGAVAALAGLSAIGLYVYRRQHSL